MAKSSAIMEFGEMLRKAKTFSTVKESPKFSFAAPGDSVILGAAPGDFSGKVCSVEVEGEGCLFARLYRHGNKIRLYYMDCNDYWKDVPAEAVTIKGEVLGIVRKYGAEAEPPKPTTAFSKRLKRAINLCCKRVSLNDFENILREHVSGRNYETLYKAFAIGYAKGKEDSQNDKA